jgi:hypothetical protein
MNVSVFSVLSLLDRITEHTRVILLHLSLGRMKKYKSAIARDTNWKNQSWLTNNQLYIF